ncbi:MFS transporter [Microbispora sp. H11081]|uniref:MFS transporter n=1 Tax=Microbispora sp. H11081 TaxID=2729107 RepID=UPI001474283F|nr:MFS transporter [Microbispora sp. H11081]
MTGPAVANAQEATAGRPRLTLTLILTVTVASFEATATATLAPAALAEIGGRSLYVLVFGLFVLAQLVALVAGGILAGTLGPLRVFVTGAALHGAGLLVCATAPFAGWLLAGRVVQGIGHGLVWVCVYVIIGRYYPKARRGRLLGWLAMAWALPALAGPLIAGVVTDTVGWRWVLAPVPVVEAVALALIWPSIVGLWHDRPGAPGGLGTLPARLAAAGLLACGVVTLMNLRHLPPAWAWPVLAASLAAVVLGGRPLLPPGALRLAPGLPAAVLLRGLAGGPWAGLAFVLPLALSEGRGLSLSAAGAALSTGIVGFAAGGLLHSTPWLARFGRPHVAIAGTLTQVAALAVTAAGLAGPIALVYAGWALTGFGANLVMIALNATVLDLASQAEQGTASAAMALADAVMTALATAAASLALAGAAGPAVTGPARALLAGCALALLAVGAALTRRNSFG